MTGLWGQKCLVKDLAMTELKASEFENGYFGEKKL
jgi:hypothetical protein